MYSDSVWWVLFLYKPFPGRGEEGFTSKSGVTSPITTSGDRSSLQVTPRLLWVDPSRRPQVHPVTSRVTLRRPPSKHERSFDPPRDRLKRPMVDTPMINQVVPLKGSHRMYDRLVTYSLYLLSCGLGLEEGVTGTSGETLFRGVTRGVVSSLQVSQFEVVGFVPVLPT